MPPTQSGGAEPTATGRPRLIAVGVSGLEGVVLVVLGLFSFVRIADGRADDSVSAALMGALALLAGAALVRAAWALWRGARWPRSPSLVWQLIMLPVGYSLLDTDRPIGTALLVAAVAAIVSLLALERDDAG